MEGGGCVCGSAVNKFIAPVKVTHGNRETNVNKTTYEPLIETALYLMLLMRANPLLGQVGGGCLEISTLLGPKWHLPYPLMPFHRTQKSLDLHGPTPSPLPS